MLADIREAETELVSSQQILQVRKGTNMEDVFHVKTECNPADCGTRVDKVKLTDVGPDSKWENGDPWMTLEIQEAVNRGVLRPATSLRVSKDIEEKNVDDFKKGLMFGQKDGLMGEFMANVSSRNKVSSTRI